VGKSVSICEANREDEGEEKKGNPSAVPVEDRELSERRERLPGRRKKKKKEGRGGGLHLFSKKEREQQPVAEKRGGRRKGRKGRRPFIMFPSEEK